MKNKTLMMSLLIGYVLIILFSQDIRNLFGLSGYITALCVASVIVFFILHLTKEDKKIGK